LIIPRGISVEEAKVAKFKVTVADSPESTSQTTFDVEGETVNVGGPVAIIYSGRNEVMFMTAVDRLIAIQRITPQ
jgi:hypothetical protein